MANGPEGGGGKGPFGLARRRLAAMLAALALLAAGSGLAGCGGEDEQPQGPRKATLVLDFVAGPAHVGIFTALERGFYRDAGIDLEVVEPSSTADTLRLIEAGKADFGIADAIDIAGQIDAGRNAKGIMAVAQRPLGGLIVRRDSGILSPAELTGGTVGVTGVPSDQAVLETELAASGGDPAQVREITVGFGGARALESRRVDAFVGFIPVDAVQVESDGIPVRSFPFDRYGGPQYPGLVVFSTERRIEAAPKLMAGFVEATVRGYEEALADPEGGLEALLAANPEIDPEFAAASFEAMQPFFTVPGVPFGKLRTGKLAELSAFLTDNDLIDAEIPPDRFATDRFLP